MTLSEVESRLAVLERGRPSYQRRNETHFEDLKRRLFDAATWCALHVDITAAADCLRDRALAPQFLARDRWHAVDDIAHIRRQKLFGIGLVSHPLRIGRLLVYFPDADLTDGAAQHASKGFLDVYNAPPWGTWVGYFEEPVGDVSYQSYLIAWIPHELVPLADAGVEVNPEACVNWLDQVDLEARAVFELLDAEAA